MATETPLWKPSHAGRRRGATTRAAAVATALVAVAIILAPSLYEGAHQTAEAPDGAPSLAATEAQDCETGTPQCPTASLSTPGLELVRSKHGRCPGSASLGRACPAWKHKGGEEEPPEPPPPAPPYDPNAHVTYRAVRHANRYPTRLAEGPDGRIYVSDPRVGSVFIYDAALTLVDEIGGLDCPLGVAVAADGAIHVGNKGRRNVEVYSPEGVKLRTIGAGAIQMPNDLAFDREGTLYVADSRGNVVRVYNGAGQWLRDIGFDSEHGPLKFPSAVAVAYRIDEGAGVEVGELYVADQGHSQIRVYDFAGGLLRAYGSQAPAFFGNWKGKFARLQSLAVDGQGRVHAADCYMNKVQILDGVTGAYIGYYGAFGTGPGKLNVPLDITITRTGKVVAANTGNHRVECIYTSW